MNEQRRRALSSLTAAVIAPTTVAQPPAIPGQAAAGMKAVGPSSRRSLGGSAMTDDGVRLYFEETGSGVPVVLVHEFAGDHRSWESVMRSYELYAQHILLIEDSPRTRHAIASLALSFQYLAYPAFPDLVARAQTLVRAVGHEHLRPHGGGRASRLLG